ncbi:uncharacterized protein LOC124374378 [Homalodisca vitripennis]|uniref:uncharacterized protein LOC124374378 n=1 Tax=Homalodisca vitripennis TaxID=197043 RepID=UPI001EEC0044|nr:uncharacterized protein LOC124374378 [Homalodisca vitripennis]
MSTNIKKPSVNVSTAKKAQVDSGVLPPRYQPPPQPKALYPLQSTSSQDADCVVAVGDSGKQFQTVAEIDRHQPTDNTYLTDSKPPAHHSTIPHPHLQQVPPHQLPCLQKCSSLCVNQTRRLQDLLPNRHEEWRQKCAA